MLLRKSESSMEHMWAVTLAGITFYCPGNSISKKLDLTVDPSTQEKKDCEEIRKLL